MYWTGSEGRSMKLVGRLSNPYQRCLRSYVQRAEESIEETLRRVIREEMRRAS